MSSETAAIGLVRPRGNPAFDLRRDANYVLRGAVVLGSVVFAAGLVLDPVRMWANFLISTFYILGLGVGALFFIAVMYVGKAAWPTAFRRVPEAMTAIIPVAGVVMLVVLALGATSIYEWANAEAVAKSRVLAGRTGWLNLPFFLARAAAYVAVWVAFAWAIKKGSRAQDVDGDWEHTYRNVKLSAVFMVFLAVSFLGAAFDWLMSVQAEWYSTIFGWYNFIGVFVSALAAMTILVIVLRRAGTFHGIITENHLHDLGKYCFAFSTFWAYLWLSQYMLIWYSNIAEETSFYTRQMHGGWTSLFVLNLGLNWVIPFVTLMPRAAKRSEGVLLKVCAVLLVGHWLDLYLMVMPFKSGSNPPFGVWEIGSFIGMLGLFFLVVFRELNQVNLLPIKDPTLEKSLHHHI